MPERVGRTVLYGIPNCDQVRRARQWLEDSAIPYRFHDLRREGVPPDRLDVWLSRLGWERITNRMSRTWKALAADSRPTDLVSARAALMKEPTLIKRPIIEHADAAVVGVDVDAWTRLFTS